MSEYKAKIDVGDGSVEITAPSIESLKKIEDVLTSNVPVTKKKDNSQLEMDFDKASGKQYLKDDVAKDKEYLKEG